MSVTTSSLSLTSLLDLSKRLHANKDMYSILNAALLTLMGKLHVVRTCALVSDGLTASTFIAKGEFIYDTFPLIPIENEPLLVQEAEHLLYHEERLSVILPIYIDGQLRAKICLGQKLSKENFNTEELTYMSLVSTIVASALHSSDIVQQLVLQKNAAESRSQLLQTLFEMSTEMGAYTTREQVLHAFTLRIMGQLFISRFAVVLHNSDSSIDVAVNRFSAEFSSDVLSSLETVTHTTFIDELQCSPDTKDYLHGIGVALIVPICVSGVWKGKVFVSKKFHGTFTEYDIRFIESYTSVLMSALENIRLFNEVIEKKKLESELLFAQQIQNKFLPDSLPKPAGADIAALNIPSRQVGGDYYDCIQTSDTTYYITVADACGKGMPASLLMANFQAALRTILPFNIAHDEMVSRLNNTIYANTASDKFLTFFGAYYDVNNYTLNYVNAGHNPPIVFRSDGSIIELTHGGMILGIMETILPYTVGHIQLTTGDVVVIFSDGVTEAMNSELQEWGDDNFQSTTLSLMKCSAQEIVTELHKSILSHTNGALQSDDITLFVLKILPV